MSWGRRVEGASAPGRVGSTGNGGKVDPCCVAAAGSPVHTGVENTDQWAGWGFLAEPQRCLCFPGSWGRGVLSNWEWALTGPGPPSPDTGEGGP